MIVAIIPARGGSKRIPRKNIRPFVGKPIIVYSIETALTCGIFERVVVSTEDEEIAEVARAAGAETPFIRPINLADDHAGTNAVVKHAIDWLSQRGSAVSTACCIYPTAPFVTVADLRRGYERLGDGDKRFVFSATTFAFPIQRAIRLLPEGGVCPFFPEWIDHRSQDLETAYHDAGQFYWGQAEAFRLELPVFATHSAPVVLPRFRVMDIDTIEDWSHAELMFASLMSADIGASREK